MIRRHSLLLSILVIGSFAACLDQPADDPDARAPDAMPSNDAMLPDAGPTPDAAINCTADDLVDQYLCGSGRKCTLVDAQNHVGCSEAGIAAAYGSCASERPDNCIIGTLCVDAKNPGEYLCLPFCSEEGAYCEGGVCTYRVSLAGGGNAYLCQPEDNCDPVAQTLGECGANEGCYLMRVGADLTYCRLAGTANLGDTCEDDFSCVPGATCFGPPNQTGTCHLLCNVGSNECGGNPCTPITESYGICS